MSSSSQETAASSTTIRPCCFRPTRHDSPRPHDDARGDVMPVGPLARDANTDEFLNGTAAGEFLLRHCPNGHFSEPAAACCTTCGPPDLEYKAAGGRARLVSWAVTHGRADDGSESLSVLAIGE